MNWKIELQRALVVPSTFVLAATLCACGSDSDSDVDTETGSDAGIDTENGDVGSDTPSTEEDAGNSDTGASDTGQTDTGQTDTGRDDTGQTDTGRDDTGQTDTGPDDTGQTDTGRDDTGDDTSGDVAVGDTDVGSDIVVVPEELGVFITVIELEELRAEGAQLFDARSAREFTEGHIPGAVNLAWNAFVEPGRNGIVYSTAEALQPIARAAGLRNDVPVVVYGNWGSGAATTARAFWNLEYIGHEEVYLLNGSFDDWRSAGVAVETGEVVPTPSDYEVVVRDDLRTTLDEIVELVASGDPNVVLIDTRTEAEWLGDDLRGNPRGGRIPTAVHLHWLDLFDADSGQLLPDAEIDAILADRGISEDSILVPYCQSGVRSGFLYALLRDRGYENATNFDGSFWEWSRDEALPVAYDAGIFVDLARFEELRADGATIVDARSARNYADGHVPGAVNASNSSFVIPDSGGIVSDDDAVLQTAARALGLDVTNPVVVYGNWGSSAAGTARIFWVLEYIGHPEVYLLNAGFTDWQTLGVPVETTINTPTPSSFVLNRQPQLRATLDEVVAIIASGDPNVVILDSRTEEEWLGDELRDNPRGGHIPNAVHLHWLDLFNAETNVLLPRGELQALLAGVGIFRTTIVVPYCQTGVRSAFFYALLRDLGYIAPRNFDGSFWEWSREEDQPVVRPDEG